MRIDAFLFSVYFNWARCQYIGMEQQEFELVETGSWSEIVQFLEQLADAIHGHVDSEKYQRFDEWRPKPEEKKQDLRERTAEEAAVNETQLEQDSAGTVAEMSHAGHEVKQGGKDIAQGKPKDSIKDVEEAGNAAAKGIFPPLIRFFRSVERFLYTQVMGKTSPNYFESGEFTVALERGFKDRDMYAVRVRFEDSGLQEQIAETLES